jgi:hypothetical protein
MIHPIKRSSGPTPNPRTHTTQQIENVRKQLGTLVQALKGGLGGRKPKLDRQRRAKPAAQARQQGGMVRVGSAMKKSRSGFLVPSLSNPDLLAEGAAAQGTSESNRLCNVCVCRLD